MRVFETKVLASTELFDKTKFSPKLHNINYFILRNMDMIPVLHENHGLYCTYNVQRLFSAEKKFDSLCRWPKGRTCFLIKVELWFCNVAAKVYAIHTVKICCSKRNIQIWFNLVQSHSYLLRYLIQERWISTFWRPILNILDFKQAG